MTWEHKYRFIVNLTFFLFFLFIIEVHPHNFFNSASEDWTAYVLYVNDGKVPVLKNPSEEADTIGFVYYRDKVLVVEETPMKFGWKMVVYPVAGYINEKDLITPEEKSSSDKRFNLTDTEKEYSKWSWEIISCSNDYVLVKSQMNEASETKGLLTDNEKTILIREQFNFQNIWVKTVYPFSGYIKYSL